MKKIRPTRILEGFSKIATKTEYSDNRLSLCNTCEFKKGSVCGICGCVLKAKTKVKQEYCPMNKWNDIKLMEAVGIAIATKDDDKVMLLPFPNGIEIVYKNYLQKGEDSNIEIEIINDRLNVEDMLPENADLTDIKLKATCGCTLIGKAPSKLKEGESFKTNISYDTERIGSFNKTIKFFSKQANFEIKLNGKVNG